MRSHLIPSLAKTWSKPHAIDLLSLSDDILSVVWRWSIDLNHNNLTIDDLLLNIDDDWVLSFHVSSSYLVIGFRFGITVW